MSLGELEKEFSDKRVKFVVGEIWIFRINHPDRFTDHFFL